MVGKRFFIGTDCYQTVFVVNPGPWKTRNPEVEFSLTPPVEIIDNSAGVSVEMKGNKKIATVDDGLPPGCNYFVTYKYSPTTNSDGGFRVACEGKLCKESPTVDLDIMMLLLIVIGLWVTCCALFFAVQFFNVKNQLISDQNSTVNRALKVLLDKFNAESDVSQSVQSLKDFKEGEGRNVRATPVKKESNGGKGKGKPKPTDD